MKVCIVGSGSQGTGLAGLLAMEEDVEKLVIADYSERNLKISCDLVMSLGDRRKVRDFTAVRVNAADPADVARVIRGCDIVFNGIIPKFNLPIMRACLQEKCHYLDLFASPYEGKGVSYEETIDAQFALDADFRAAGLLALPSVGMSPGWTSLAASYMMEGMDQVDDVIIRWGDWVDTDELLAPISAITLMHEWFGAPSPVRTLDGQPDCVDLVDSEEKFEFPAPIGRRKIYTVTAHPDIVLIPKFSEKPIHICEEKGGVFMRRYQMKDIWLKCMQQATSRQGDGKSEMNILEEMAQGLIPAVEYDALLKAGKIRDHAVCFSCEARGVKDGARIRHICYYTSTLEVSLRHLPWASPAVYGTIGGMPIELVLAMGRGQLPQTGVWSVGKLGITESLNRAMAKRGQILTERVERTMGV